MAQRLCLDVEALLAAVAPLLQQMGDMQGFQYPVNLSVEALNDFSSELLEVPAVGTNHMRAWGIYLEREPIA